MLTVSCLLVFAVAINGKKDRKYDLGTIMESNGDGIVHAYMFFGEVEAGEFSYYELKAEGRLRVVLQSLSGDADLYLSFLKKYPSIDVYGHDMVSASCGIDSVDIPLFSKRPVYVGVYGHPSKPKSLFKLMLLVMQSNDTEFEPYISFQPEEIHNFFESKIMEDRQSGEINSFTNYLLLLLKVLLEAVVEIAL